MLSDKLCETINKPNLIEDGILSSPHEGKWTPIQPKGSYYQTLAAQTEQHICDNGDWIWLSNEVNGETITAREALDYGKR